MVDEQEAGITSGGVRLLQLLVRVAGTQPLFDFLAGSAFSGTTASSTGSLFAL